MTSTTKALSYAYALHKIEHAPNVRILIAAYDAAVGGSDLSVHRKAGTEWTVWQGEHAGFTGTFAQVRAHLAARAEEILDHEAADQIASVPATAMVMQQAQQQQACAAPAASKKPWVSQWTRISSRTYGDALIGVLAAVQTEFPYGRYETRGLPVVRVEGARHIMLGWAENEDAAAACGTAWEYAFDVAVLVRDGEREVAYVLIGDGRPFDVDADTLQRLRDHDEFQATITGLDADGAEVDEIDERAVQWQVGDGHARWTFDSHNAACLFAELCDASGFVPAMDGKPPMVPQQAQQQQACAAAPVAHPAGVPTNAWLDEEVASFIDGVIRELMPDEDDGAPRPRVDALEVATLDAYVATRAWLDLVDRECATPFSVTFGALFDARQVMQAAHARLDALTAQAAS